MFEGDVCIVKCFMKGNSENSSAAALKSLSSLIFKYDASGLKSLMPTRMFYIDRDAPKRTNEISEPPCTYISSHSCITSEALEYSQITLSSFLESLTVTGHHSLSLYRADPVKNLEDWSNGGKNNNKALLPPMPTITMK